MLISEAFEQYQNNYMLLKYQSIRMVETHQQVRRSLVAAIGDKDVSDFSLNDLGVWHRSIARGRCQNTVRNYVSCIRNVLRYLELQDIRSLKSALVVVPKRIDTRVEYLTRDEVQTMIDNACSLRNQFSISLLFCSGIRLSEFISLNRDHIRNKSFTVVGKGGKARLCFIDQRTEALMKAYLATRTDYNDALVVSNLHKDRMTASNVQLFIKNSAKRAGINRHITPHTLRHSFATDFLHNGGDVRYLQVLLGHASLNTTMRYTHVADNDLEQTYRKYHGL